MIPDGIEYRDVLANLLDGVYVVDTQRRISFWNQGAEKITGFSAAEVLGRACSDNILVHVTGQGARLCLGGCPLAQTLADGAPRQLDAYLHHKAGHMVPVRIQVEPVRNRSGEVVAAVETFSDNSEKIALLERIAELEQTALLDPLTGLANRRFVQDHLSVCLDERKRYGWPFGILFMDIDRFKQVNDTHGHEVGDEVLKLVGRVLENNLRSFDLVGRWGGEEFIVVCMNLDCRHLCALAERLRVLVQESALTTRAGEVRVTVSIGAATPRPEEGIKSLIERADEFMYQSKKAGRNRVTYAD